jgi:hypothetical protein
MGCLVSGHAGEVVCGMCVAEIDGRGLRRNEVALLCFRIGGGGVPIAITTAGAGFATNTPNTEMIKLKK